MCILCFYARETCSFLCRNIESTLSFIFCDDEKIIVTTSERFIGKALCQELVKRNVEVIGIDRKMVPKPQKYVNF